MKAHVYHYFLACVSTDLAIDGLCHFPTPIATAEQYQTLKTFAVSKTSASKETTPDMWRVVSLNYLGHQWLKDPQVPADPHPAPVSKPGRKKRAALTN